MDHLPLMHINGVTLRCMLTWLTQDNSRPLNAVMAKIGGPM